MMGICFELFLHAVSVERAAEVEQRLNDVYETLSYSVNPSQKS